MKKVLIVLAILAIVLLACGKGSKVTGRKIVLPPESGITGETVVETETRAGTGQEEQTGQTEQIEQEKTAAEVLEEMKELGVTGATSGTSLYPQVSTNATGVDALKAKTRALMTGSPFDPNADADTSSGPKYHTSSGKPTNLPDEYGEGCKYCGD